MVKFKKIEDENVLGVYVDGQYFGTILRYGQNWMLGDLAIFPSVVSSRKEAAEALIWQRKTFG